MSDSKSQIIDYFKHQAESCAKLGSPFTRDVILILASLLEPLSVKGSMFTSRLLEWNPSLAFSDAVALRAAGALHALARSGKDVQFSKLYPDTHSLEFKNDISNDKFPYKSLTDALPIVILNNDSYLTSSLSSAPQTNEVRRSSAYLGVTLYLSKKYNLPFQLFEIGSSAGFNLLFDKFRYELDPEGEKQFSGGISWGDANSIVTVPSKWSGPSLPPLDTSINIVSRAGCDLNPLSCYSSIDVEKLISYTWADQKDRIERLEKAIELTKEIGIKIDKGDAVEWVRNHFRPGQLEKGHIRVLMHTICWQYLSDTSKQEIINVMNSAGEYANNDQPLVWIRLEDDPKNASKDDAAIQLTVWPGGETRILGRGDWHGRYMRWNIQ